MHPWFRCLRVSLPNLNPDRRSCPRRPRVEILEDRCLLAGGVLTNACFVAQVYRDLLHREADPAGLTAFSNALDQGTTDRFQVALAIENSVEFRTDAIQALYQGLLGRPADPGGLNTWLQLLGQGGSRLQVEAGILGSDEYVTNRGGGTVNGFLQALFVDALHRPIDAGGLQAFTQALTVGIPATTSTTVITPVTQPVTVSTTAGTTSFGSTGTIPPLAVTSVPPQAFGPSPPLSIIGAMPPLSMSAPTGLLVGGPLVGTPTRIPGTTGGVPSIQPVSAGPVLATRQQVALAVLTSQEADAKAVQTFYSEFLHRAADPGGAAGFVRALQQNQTSTNPNTIFARQGLTEEQVAARLIASDEYFAMLNC